MWSPVFFTVLLLLSDKSCLSASFCNLSLEQEERKQRQEAEACQREPQRVGEALEGDGPREDEPVLRDAQLGRDTRRLGGKDNARWMRGKDR